MIRTLLFVAGYGFALDTTRVFDLGFSDVEFYLGAANLGHGDEAAYGLETVFGIGLVERFGLAVGTVWESNYELAGKTAALGVNWVFSDTGELITEVGWDNDTEEDSYHAVAGMIFTLPVGGGE